MEHDRHYAIHETGSGICPACGDNLDLKELRDFAASFLGVTARPNEPIAVTLEQIAAFADRLRRNCMHDLERLILNCIEDCRDSDKGKDVLRIFGAAIVDQGTEDWGIPDKTPTEPSDGG